MSPVILNPAARTQMLTPAIIGVLALLALISISTPVSAWWPLNPSDAQWQYQALAGFLRAVPLCAFLLIVLSFVAVHGGQYTTVRRTALGMLALAALLVPALVLFVIDFRRIRRGQPSDTIARFTVEALRLAGTSGLLMLTLVWAGRRGLAASILDKGPRRREAGEGLVVGQGEDTPF